MRKLIFSNDNFLVDYDPKNQNLRISYFEDFHYVDEVSFTFPFRCMDCKYLGESCNCMHPDASYCQHGELWWPQ